MIRNTMMPFARSGMRIEPSLDRFLGRALDLPMWNEGTDVQELEDKAVVTMDVPGVKPEQVSVTAENRVLTIKVQRDGRDAVTRHFTVGSTYDLAHIDARLELGVLTLTLPKAAEAQPRAIEVKVA